MLALQQLSARYLLEIVGVEMFKLLVVMAAIALTAFMVVGQSEQAERTAQQGMLLERLEALNTPQVSLLVDEWREAYPSPSAERLTELRVLVQRVSADPRLAEQYTASARQRKFDALGVESPFGSVKASPGIGPVSK